MRRSTLFFAIAALPFAGCALIGYNLDGYEPAPSTGGAGGSGGEEATGSTTIPTSTSTGGGGSDKCKNNSDCPHIECQENTCMDGVCRPKNSLPGHSCSAGKCDDAGLCVHACTMASDCGQSTECNIASCDQGTCTRLFPTGKNCMNGVCDSDGNCTPQCGTNAPCAASSNPCILIACLEGKCTPTFPGLEKVCATRGPGDQDQCDGKGNCVDCVDSGGCNEAQKCEKGACVKDP